MDYSNQCVYPAAARYRPASVAGPAGCALVRPAAQAAVGRLSGHQTAGRGPRHAAERCGTHRRPRPRCPDAWPRHIVWEPRRAGDSRGASYIAPTAGDSAACVCHVARRTVPTWVRASLALCADLVVEPPHHQPSPRRTAAPPAESAFR